jgi:selenocysteine-specific elongation factor
MTASSTMRGASWHVIGTAGHVDHGKSTLVHALTGVDPDRWAEEKARGLTIDLGFASTVLPSGRGIAFVDVPGHIRFLRNMLAGAGAIDACLFVVAATEGWKPQSEEHLRIVELLGVRHGLIALTKVGLTDEHPDLGPRVKSTFLEGAPVVPVDVPAGIGVDALRDALDALVAGTPAAVDRGWPRLWVDRAFAAKGAGTVVTGTLTGGRLRVGDELEVAGRRVRVRGLQSHGEPLDDVVPGRRVAVNLTGVAHDEVERGHALVRPGQWFATRTVDAALSVLPALDHPVTRRGAYVAYIGSGEHPVTMRVLGPTAMEPGASGRVRLRLPTGLPLLPGDRFVLRESGRGETVGGGEIVDVDPTRRDDGWVDAAALEQRTGSVHAPTVGRWVVDATTLDAARDRLRRRVDDAGPLGLDVAGLDERERAVATGFEGYVVDGGRVRAAGATDPLADHPWLAALAAQPFTPPPADGVAPAEVRELVKRNLVLESDGIWFAPSAIEEAGRVVARLLRDRPDGVTVAEIRDALGTTRKYLLPLLGILDGSGVTRRRGDLRVGGPRLPL